MKGMDDGEKWQHANPPQAGQPATGDRYTSAAQTGQALADAARDRWRECTREASRQVNNQLQEAMAAASQMAGRELAALGEQVAAQLTRYTHEALAELRKGWGFAPPGLGYDNWGKRR